MAKGDGKVSAWVLFGLAFGGLIYAITVCGGEEFRMCDGKISKVKAGAECPVSPPSGK